MVKIKVVGDDVFQTVKVGNSDWTDVGGVWKLNDGSWVGGVYGTDLANHSHEQTRDAALHFVLASAVTTAELVAELDPE